MSNTDQRQTSARSGAWDDAQKQVRDRNEEARRNAKREREESDRRLAAEQRQRDERAGVYR